MRLRCVLMLTIIKYLTSHSTVLVPNVRVQCFLLAPQLSAGYRLPKPSINVGEKRQYTSCLARYLLEHAEFLQHILLQAWVNRKTSAPQMVPIETAIDWRKFDDFNSKGILSVGKNL